MYWRPWKLDFRQFSHNHQSCKSDDVLDKLAE